MAALFPSGWRNLLNVDVGDTITVKEADGTRRKVKITGITEMYMGHFLFMNKTAYQKAFNTNYKVNGHLVTLNDRSISNTRAHAAQFMKEDGVKGVDSEFFFGESNY